MMYIGAACLSVAAVRCGDVRPVGECVACLHLVFNRLVLLIGHYITAVAPHSHVTIFLSDVVEVHAMMLNQTGMLLSITKQGIAKLQ